MPSNITTLLLIGPSGVGKSSAVGIARSHRPDCDFHHLDDLVTSLARSRGMIGLDRDIQELRRIHSYEQFLQVGKDAVQNAVTASRSRAVVIDVGAGFVGAPSFLIWMKQHISIAMTAPMEESFARLQGRVPMQSIEQDQAQWNHPRWAEVRRLADYPLPVDYLDRETAGARFCDLLGQILAQTPL